VINKIYVYTYLSCDVKTIVLLLNCNIFKYPYTQKNHNRTQVLPYES
jgi:hypothetical protein